MKVILIEDVKSLGKKGDLVNAKTGYARNYLLPNRLAIEGTKENIAKWKEEQKEKQKEYEQEKQKAIELKKELEKLSLKFKIKTGENGKVFGAITTRDIENALLEKGYEFTKKDIVLKENIKSLKTTTVDIKLFYDVVATIEVVVDKE